MEAPTKSAVMARQEGLREVIAETSATCNAEPPPETAIAQYHHSKPADRMDSRCLLSSSSHHGRMCGSALLQSLVTHGYPCTTPGGSVLAATLDEHGDDTERGDERRTRQNTGSTLSS